MAGVMTSADNTKVLDIDFVGKFSKNVDSLLEILDIYEPTILPEGHQIKQYTISGTLEDGDVAEGTTIPLTKYTITNETPIRYTLKQYRKQTSKDGVLESGYEGSVARTDREMISGIQGVIRKELFKFLSAGTGTATGVGMQSALANAWAELGNEMDRLNKEGTPVFFVNRKDVAEYLGAVPISTQTAFGLSYVRDFLGLGTCILANDIPEGTFYATPSENINCYVADLGALAKAGFDYTYDETGLIGVNHHPVYENGTVETIADTGLMLFPEVKNLIIKGTITKPTAKASR